MRVCCGDPREASSRGAGMRGFPHSYDPERTMMGELWVGVTPSGRSPMKRIPMKRDPEGCEAKGRGLNIKQYQAR
jgi:hypothetical protein